MKKSIRHLTYCMPILLSIVGTNAQSIEKSLLSSAGTEFSTSTINLSWSLGEAMIGLYSNANLSINEGFESSSTILGIIPVTGLDDEVLNLYPNPTAGVVHIRIEDTRHALAIKLFSSEGVLLRQFNPQKGSKDSEIDLSRYAAGQYLLKIYNSEKRLLKSSRIILIQ